MSTSTWTGEDGATLSRASGWGHPYFGIRPSAKALAGELSQDQVIGAAGGTLAPALLKNWGERQR